MNDVADIGSVVEQLVERALVTETAHRTQKPVECMRRPMFNNSEPGDGVYEPFLGSGTTLIAAEATRRVCFAIELDPLYVDVAVRRWQTFTGRKSTLQADGRCFDAVAAEGLAQSSDPAPSPECTNPAGG